MAYLSGQYRQLRLRRDTLCVFSMSICRRRLRPRFGDGRATGPAGRICHRLLSERMSPARFREDSSKPELGVSRDGDQRDESDESANVSAAAVLRSLGLADSCPGEWRSGDGMVGAELRPSELLIGWVDVAWPGPCLPVARLRDLQRISLRDAEAASGVEACGRAIATAGAQREAALRTCRLCEQRFTPGHMHDDRTCQGCAERHLGVVH